MGHWVLLTNGGRAERRKMRRNWGTQSLYERRALPAGKIQRESRGRERRRTTQEYPPEVAGELRHLFQCIQEQGTVDSTNITRSTHWSYWEDFYHLMKINKDKFGKCEAVAVLALIGQVNAECGALSVFATFVVFYSRQKSKEINRASYAEKCVPSVRSHYARK